MPCLQSCDSLDAQNPDEGQEVNRSLGRDTGKPVLCWHITTGHYNRKPLHMLDVKCSLQTGRPLKQ